MKLVATLDGGERLVFILVGGNLDMLILSAPDAPVCVSTFDDEGNWHQFIVTKNRLSDICVDDFED